MKSHNKISRIVRTATLLFLLVQVFACSPSKKNPGDVESKDSVVCQTIPELTSDDIMKIISCIPDHGIENAPEEAFAEDYYSLLKEAWAIPTDAPGGIGSEEWLFYFMSGNGDSYDHIDIISNQTEGDKATVDFECVWNDEDKTREKHCLNLVCANDSWIIEDFDGTREKLQQHIKDLRNFFRSDEWEEQLKNDGLSVEEIKAAQKDVTDYFEKYPNDRD